MSRPKSIFYSWQSDLPNNINRGFILDCLKKAVREIAKDADLSVDYDVDRDTLDVSGSPDIVSTIFDKIEHADIFVADVTIVTGDEKSRHSPNPNVLIELGYAAKHVGWENIVCVNNLAFGKIEELPFDLRSRRIIMYDMPTDTEDKSEARKALIGKLTSAIRSIHDDLPRFASKLQLLFNRINPSIIQAMQQGCRQISINVNSRNEDQLHSLLESPLGPQLIAVESNGNFLSNNTNSTGGINDVGAGTLSGYSVTVLEPFVQFLA
jgi:hypothetical protein